MIQDHRYALGTRVRVTGRFAPSAKAAGVYTIVQFLPDQGDGDRQYRIKSETERHERVVTESQLTQV
jgi:hypothetical protein